MITNCFWYGVMPHLRFLWSELPSKSILECCKFYHCYFWIQQQLNPTLQKCTTMYGNLWCFSVYAVTMYVYVCMYAPFELASWHLNHKVFIWLSQNVLFTFWKFWIVFELSPFFYSFHNCPYIRALNMPIMTINDSN